MAILAREDDAEEFGAAWPKRQHYYFLDEDGFFEVWSWAFDKCGMQENCDLGLEWWHPNDFLNALPAPMGENASKADETKFFAASLADLKPKMEGGTRLDPLYLDINTCSIHHGEVRGCLTHEGRHRAYTAREVGIEWVPVIVVRPKGHETMIKPCYR